MNLFDQNKIYEVHGSVNYLQCMDKNCNNLNGVTHAENLPNQLESDYKPVFMIGFPRSGTTLLDTILRSHPMIDVIEEKSSVKKLVNSLSKLTNKSFQMMNDVKKENIKR